LSKRKHISIITLGCSKNTVDSEVLAGQLSYYGYKVRWDDARPAETVIINTCGFIGDARQESVDTIMGYLQLKDEGKISKVFVMGCLAHRYKNELLAELPGVDGFFGVTDFKSIIEKLNGDERDIHLTERLLSTPKHYAYLKISEGCDRSCSFCAIPMIRGKNISRSLGSLEEEAILLAEKGVKELNIIAQDTTSYGIDLYGKRMLTPLLEKLVSPGKFEWIRLHYTFPAGFPDDVLEIMSAHPSICNYVDIPLQHISDRILFSMKRGITAAGTHRLLDRMRKKVPGVAIRTAFIVGYPGETRKEFIELLSFIKERRFERLGVFKYSHEEGTSAFRNINNVSNKAKIARAEELMAVQQEISLGHNRKLVGSVLKVLIDRKEGEYYVGRTEFDSPEVDNEVLIPVSSANLLIGSFYSVKITGAEEFDLFGERNDLHTE
jgi:ribosomal protein S12 methylthiotransferase